MIQYTERDKVKRDYYMLKDLISQFKRCDISNNHPLQRYSDRWSSQIKSAYIGSILKDEDIDSIKICEEIHSEGIQLWLIDGGQRLTTAMSFQVDGFKISKNIEYPIIKYKKILTDDNGRALRDVNGRYRYELVECDIRGKKYSTLPDELKEKFDSYQVEVVKQLDCTKEEIGYHIRRYNNKINMNGNEKLITYLDNIAYRVKTIASNMFFRNCTNIKDGEFTSSVVERIIIDSLILMYYPEIWKKTTQVKSAHLNENVTSEQLIEFEEILNDLQSLEDDFEDLFTKRDSNIFISMYKSFKDNGYDEENYRDFLTEFKTSLRSEEVNGKSFDDIINDRNTKSTKRINCAMDILKELANKFFDTTEFTVIKENPRVENEEETGEFICEDLDATEEIHTEEIETDTEENTDYSQENLLSFIRDNITEDIISDDIDFYEDTLNEYCNRLENKIDKEKVRENLFAMIAITAYSFQKEIDLTDWLVEYVGKTTEYKTDQRELYKIMKQDFDKYYSSTAA